MSNNKIEIKWALVFIVVSILWLVLAKMLGMFTSRIDSFPWFSMLFVLPAVLVFVVALLEKKKQFYNGSMSFRQGFISGMTITVIVTICTPLSQYIFHNFIAPEFFPNIIKHSVGSGEMTQEKAEAFFNLKSYIIQSTVASLASGIITSLIVAFFVKSKTNLLTSNKV